MWIKINRVNLGIFEFDLAGCTTKTNELIL